MKRYVTVGRPSVCPSVCLSHHSPAHSAAAAGLLLCARRAGDIHRLLHGRHSAAAAPQHGAQHEQTRAVSRSQLAYEARHRTVLYKVVVERWWIETFVQLECCSNRVRLPQSLLRPDWGTEYCDDHLCLSVCLSVRARAYLRNYTADLHPKNFCACYPRRLYILCWREHSRRKLSPTLATAYYSCPANASSPM